MASSRAIRGGVASAGTNCIATNSPAVATGLPVMLEDHDRERDLAEPVPELVDEVGARDPAEPRQPERREAPFSDLRLRARRSSLS